MEGWDDQPVGSMFSPNGKFRIPCLSNPTLTYARRHLKTTPCGLSPFKTTLETTHYGLSSLETLSETPTTDSAVLETGRKNIAVA